MFELTTALSLEWTKSESRCLELITIESIKGINFNNRITYLNFRGRVFLDAPHSESSSSAIGGTFSAAATGDDGSSKDRVRRYFLSLQFEAVDS